MDASIQSVIQTDTDYVFTVKIGNEKQELRYSMDPLRDAATIISEVMGDMQSILDSMAIKQSTFVELQDKIMNDPKSCTISVAMPQEQIIKKEI